MNPQILTTSENEEVHEAPRELNKSIYPEMSMQELINVLDLTIKEDSVSKLITFYCMLSAYTHDSQINVSFNAPSSSGKTYITTEIAKLFPDEDKIESSGASPTSFYYTEGEEDEERNAKVISFERKILLFLEQGNSAIQTKLRPILSHDSWEINYRITNKNKSGGNRTELIILQGFPATVFCSAGLRLDEQEATRAILLSPEPSQAKIQAAIELQNKRGKDEKAYIEWLESQPERVALKERIIAVRDEYVEHIKLPDNNAIKERFYKTFPKLRQRHTRDFIHLQQLIKVIALLNLWHRKHSDGSIVANQSDIDQAFELWEQLAQSQNLGIPPTAIYFYKTYILPAFYDLVTAHPNTDPYSLGVSREQLSREYLHLEKTTLPETYLRKEILPQLEASGLITQQVPEVGDRRTKLIYPKWFPEQTI
ncbi:MAG: hypothetical protein WC498_03700 [Candidatus Saccharimonadales bacterium]